MSTSRETVRDALAALLETALVGDGLLAEEVVNHVIVEPPRKSPTVAVVSRGTNRLRMTYEGDRPDFLLLVQVWIRTSLPDGSWTAADTENRLDAIEAVVAQVVEANRKAAEWSVLQYAASSEINPVNTETGIPYSVEVIPILAKLFRS